MRSVDVRVTGHVQGVFFRLSTRNRAVELGVRGSVRNEPDGSVSISAEADAFGEAFASDQGREGLNAFLEKRKPNW